MLAPKTRSPSYHSISFSHLPPSIPALAYLITLWLRPFGARPTVRQPSFSDRSLQVLHRAPRMITMCLSNIKQKIRYPHPSFSIWQTKLQVGEKRKSSCGTCSLPLVHWKHTSDASPPTNTLFFGP